MITNAVLNFVFGLFGFIFDLLPIPSAPGWLQSGLDFVVFWVAKGTSLFTWLFPQEIYTETITIICSCLIVRFSYDLYLKFHSFHIS